LDPLSSPSLIPSSDNANTPWRKLWPWLVTAAIVAAAVCQLHNQGRSWWCSCGQPTLWNGAVLSSHGSQHLFDPYSFTHVLHGVLLYGLLAWACPRLPPAWRFCLTVAIEALWEVFENTDFTIRRYRTLTIALGYEGDTITNSLGDLASCCVGWLLARRLGLRGSLVLFVTTELVLILWIGDSLVLDVVRLILTR
jgi:hypothetical protein